MKRIFTLTALAIAITAACAAQTPTNVGAPTSSTTGEYEDVTYIPGEEPETSNDSKYYDKVEIQPSFPGGDAAMYQWLGKNQRYPDYAVERNIQGRVMVNFVVFKDGSIGEIKVLRSPDPSLSKEAIRLIESMPKWTPGKMGGKPVNVCYTLPIPFKLYN